MVTRNIIAIAALCVMFSSCHFSQATKQNQSNQDKIEKVEIKSVNLLIMTCYAIDCDSFDNSFSQAKVTTITDSSSIGELSGILGSLEPTDSTYSDYVDTRAKIKLISNRDTSEICLNYLMLSKDGTLYKTPKELVDYIERLNSPSSGIK